MEYCNLCFAVCLFLSHLLWCPTPICPAPDMFPTFGCLADSDIVHRVYCNLIFSCFLWEYIQTIRRIEKISLKVTKNPIHFDYLPPSNGILAKFRFDWMKCSGWCEKSRKINFKDKMYPEWNKEGIIAVRWGVLHCVNTGVYGLYSLYSYGFTQMCLCYYLFVVNVLWLHLTIESNNLLV